MGFKISWIGFEKMGAVAVAERAGLLLTSKVDEANETPFSIAELPSGWTILFVNDVEYAFGDRPAQLSRGNRVITFQVHEGVMYSRAAEFRDGICIWAVEHDSDSGVRHLETAGDLPSDFEAIRTECLKAQDAEGENAMIDHIIDIPAKLAMSPTGYRYDQWRFDWGQPVFYEAASR